MTDDPKTVFEPRRVAGPEMYFVFDAETNGPVPGPFSMLSVGIVALDPDSLNEVGSFSARLRPLLGATEDAATMRWWSGFPEQYALATKEPRLDPADATHLMEDWVSSMVAHFVGPDGPVKPVFVGYPATFDFAFYCYYAHVFTGQAKLGFAALDMASMAMGFDGQPYSQQTRKKWPAEWVIPEDREAVHEALADARQQATIFCNQMRSVRKGRCEDGLAVSGAEFEMLLDMTEHPPEAPAEFVAAVRRHRSENG